VAALRALGQPVATFTVRPCPPEELRSAAMRADAATTGALLGSPAREWIRAHAALLVTDPAAWARGLVTALGSGPLRPRARLWQIFYFGEAVLLWHRMRASGIRHLHVHFANNGADVARLVVTIGNAASRLRERGWSWSFAMHGPTEFADPVGHDLAAKTRQAGFVACISAYARDQLRRLAPEVTVERLPIVRMGVDADAFPPAAEQRAERAGGGERPLRLLFVGRLVREKAPEVLLDALARLAQPIEVVLIGAGPLAEELAGRVEREGLGDRVRLLGPIGQDELPDWYAWADVFCLPSRHEGVPVVLMEAMATELPVVTTRIAGIPELVENGQSGILTTPGDAAGLAAALSRLADDPALRRRYGQAARARVLAEFTPRPNARRLAALFAGIAPDTSA